MVVVAKPCKLPECDQTTDHPSGYHTDECLQADMAPDYLPPVTVLAPNKAGGFGHDINWMVPQPVRLTGVTE